jgi:hypothetical protein
VLFLETWADLLEEKLSELQRAELRRLETSSTPTVQDAAEAIAQVA